jgi:nucleotide-binding universal stress UspA family protein
MLPIHTIIFPTDFSDNAQHAFPLACSLARDCGAAIIVLYVMPPPLGHEQVEVHHAPEQYYAGARQALHQIQSPHENVRVEHRLLEGDAAKVIVEVSRATPSSMIVMGTHGRTGIGRLVLGSVAEQVLRKAPCPVLTVKVPGGE